MKMTDAFSIRLHLCFILFSLSNAAFPQKLSGTVADQTGKPVPVAMISLFRADNLYLETVYAGQDGNYSLETALEGELTLRVRSPGYTDKSLDVSIPDKEDFSIVNNIELRLSTEEKEISDNLTASSQFSVVRLNDEKAQKYFQNDCLSCHQLGNALSRQVRTREAWKKVITRMLVFHGVKASEYPELRDSYVELLGSSFNGTVVVRKERHAYEPLYANILIREWKFPGAEIAHDAMVNTHDGLFYTVDQGTDEIFITDPETNKTEIFPIPATTSTKDNTKISVHGPHSLQEDAQGKFYLTDSYANQIGFFDPISRQYQGYDIKEGGSSPHTLRIDRKGRVWFTLIRSNDVGMFDPVNQEMHLIELPPTSNRDNYPGLHPYGIDIHPQDGSIWYSRLSAHKIGRIDPETREVEEYDPPFLGPRRLRFAADSTLWIPAFADGAIARLNTETMEYKIYKIPTLTPDGVEAPYALAVHPTTGDIWITANMSDRMFQFIPAEERFIAYPLPTRGHYLRDIFFTKEGWACGPSSPLPATTAVEGGMQALICIIATNDR